ncbi:hypothetical protein CTI12_AA411900 [Artemisia annua]|uniref:Uncharacterized protein n=1 Tax=Artemisia annua TaxID=35608 RepID=A0A2U1M742_ARTAN|nr:hypothetical protein CTI12_AA411900 [Artemisia annua]
MLEEIHSELPDSWGEESFVADTYFTNAIITTHNLVTTSMPCVIRNKCIDLSSNCISNTHESATAVEVGENSTQAANIDQDAPLQPREPRAPRGAYLNKNIPTFASEWKVIHIYGLNCLEPEVPRMISKDFKGNFYGKETEWHKLDKTLVEHFVQMLSVDPKWAKHVWTKRAQRLCSGTWNAIRAKCKKE